MRSLSTLLIVGFVAAGSLEPYSWTPSQEYRYTYSAQVLSGIPELNNQYSGLTISATVRIQPKEDSTCRIQLEQPRLINYNENIEFDNENKPTQSGQEVSIPSQVKTWLETPFTVYHKRGLVEKILFENGEPEFIVNVKKGLTSQIQLDLSKATEVSQNQVRGQTEILPAFKVNEASTVGECGTEYSISKLAPHLIIQLQGNELLGDSACEGKEHYEIIKTKNLEFCSNRPVYHSSVGVWPKNAGSQSSLPSHSTVTRTIICGSLQDHYIRKSNTESRILVGIAGSVNTEEKITTSVYSTLKLESVQRAQREIPEPSSPKGYPSLIYEFPSGSSTSSQSLKRELMQQDDQQQNQQQQQKLTKEQLHAPLPDLTSTPQIFHIKGSSQRDLKQKAIEVITEMFEYAENPNDSSKTKKDVAGLSVSATKFLSMLSLEELKEVEQTIISQSDRRGQHQLIKKAFFDLVSMAGTNPCVMLIKEKVMTGEVNEEPASWSWILSNTLRSVQTPTPELLRELVQLAKSENIQKNRIIRAAYLMGLSDLINKACVNPESIENQFAYRIYGQMCNKEMEIIKGDLVPFLTQKLQEATRENLNSVITYINALGNIGIEETTQELLKIVEGKLSTNPYPKSIAVYKLIRPAMLNPTLYRPIFLSLIENSAEDPLVRMAAVTALPYTVPSSADLQKLALRTWFEPSQQVSSYIYSTLKSLSQLSSSVPTYESIKNKAQIVLPLARQVNYGYQYSQNLQFTTFVETLKTAVSHKLQWTASQDSSIPRTVYTKAEINAKHGSFDAIETMLYMQGSETIIEKLYDLYSSVEGPKENENQSKIEREAEEIIGKLNIREKRYERPEAHLNIKFMGMEKLFSVDEELIEKIVSSFSSEVMENMEALERGLKTEYFKVLELFSNEYSIPTEAGIPVHVFIRMPTVAYNKAELKLKQVSASHPTLEVETVGVTNYKRQVQVGTMCPVSNKFAGAALETSMHISAPLKGEIAIRKGQVLVSLKQLEQPEYQREQNLLEFNVQPFTFAHRLDETTLVGKSSGTKTIASRNPKIEREVLIGKPFGLDAKIRVETEEPGLDLYKLWEDLKINVPVFLSSLPTPITTGRKTNIKVSHNPSNSEVKELDFYLSAEIASKLQNQQVMTVLLPQDNQQEIQRICQEYSPQQLQQCQSQLVQKQQRQEDDVIQECQEEQILKQQQLQNEQQKKQIQQEQLQTLEQQLQQQIYKQQQHQQNQQVQQDQYLQQKKQQCLLSRQLCKEERKLCIETLEQLGLNRDEFSRKCLKAHELCRQSSHAKQQVQGKLLALNEGRAAAIAFGVILRAREESQERRIEAHIAIAHKPVAKGLDKIHPTFNAVVKTPMLRQPFDLKLEGEWKMKRPVERWNLEEMIKEDLTNEMYINGVYGLRGEKKQSIKASVMIVKSEQHQNFIRSLEEVKMCSRDQSQGRMLTKNCKESRHLASSLDVAHTKLSIPREIALNPWTRMATEAVKLVSLPYLTQHPIARKETGNQQEYDIMTKVQGKGETISATISGNGEQIEVRNIRLGKAFRGLLPICTRETLLQRIIQRSTAYNAPSSCVIEAGKISTFDKVEYSYPLNDCEHVAFAERSNRPRIVVTTKKDQVKQQVKMIVDGQKFEIEIKKGSRYARDTRASIKINEQEKELTSQDQQDTIISKYADGVYSIYSRKYQIEVVADGERLEVRSPQHIFRNRVTGICGDLNGERSADVKSAKQCIVTKPKISAFSFMIEDGKCQGIPQQEKSELQRQEQRCIREEEIPTRVYQIFRQYQESRPQPEQRHLIEDQKEKICISKELVRICSRSYPKQVVSKQVGFACISGPQSEIFKNRVIGGDFVEELERFPTEYVKTVHEPRQC